MESEAPMTMNAIHQHNSITVCTGDRESAEDAVASLTASLAAMSTGKPPLQPINVNTIHDKPFTRERKRPASPPAPRYAQHTAASERRKAATERSLADLSAEMAAARKKKTDAWGREPTVPKSPNFAIAGGIKGLNQGQAQPITRRHSFTTHQAAAAVNGVPSRQFARSSTANAMFDSGSVQHGRRNSVATMANNGKKKKKQRGSLTTTVPKSPNFRARGPSSAYNLQSQTHVNQQVPLFKPTPLPDYLIDLKVLPDIKMNAKALAAMEFRTNPNLVRERAVAAAAAQREREPVQQQLSATVPLPFELRGVSAHEDHVAAAEARRAMEEEEEKARRKFKARPVNEAILDGPTFVPVRSDVPLTRPTDLLPFATERSERTRAFEARQRERMEEMEQQRLQAQAEREQAEDIEARQQYEAIKFKPRKVPRTTYEPTLPPRPGSRSSGSSNKNNNSQSTGRNSMQNVSAHLTQTSNDHSGPDAANNDKNHTHDAQSHKKPVSDNSAAVVSHGSSSDQAAVRQQTGQGQFLAPSTMSSPTMSETSQSHDSNVSNRSAASKIINWVRSSLSPTNES